jgi:hypothetical protein
MRPPPSAAAFGAGALRARDAAAGDRSTVAVATTRGATAGRRRVTRRGGVARGRVGASSLTPPAATRGSGWDSRVTRCRASSDSAVVGVSARKRQYADTAAVRSPQRLVSAAEVVRDRLVGAVELGRAAQQRSRLLQVAERLGVVAPAGELLRLGGVRRGGPGSGGDRAARVGGATLDARRAPATSRVARPAWHPSRGARTPRTRRAWSRPRGRRRSRARTAESGAREPPFSEEMSGREWTRTPQCAGDAVSPGAAWCRPASPRRAGDVPGVAGPYAPSTPRGVRAVTAGVYSGGTGVPERAARSRMDRRPTRAYWLRDLGGPVPATGATRRAAARRRRRTSAPHAERRLPTAEPGRAHDRRWRRDAGGTDDPAPELTADEAALLEQMPALADVGSSRRQFLGQTRRRRDSVCSRSICSRWSARSAR